MKIPFEKEYRQRYFDLLQEAFDSDFLSEGTMVRRFEDAFAAMIGHGVEAVAVANCGLGLLALMESVGASQGEVVVPSNTFMATPLAAVRSGAEVVFVDCNREDLCLSLDDLKKRITLRTRAVVMVHIGGHIAFEMDEILKYLSEREIPLIEDCAHAHGASLHGRAAGAFGLGGVYSFYATKTMPLGEGGMVVTTSSEVAEYVRKWRNYGKFDYKIPGFNARMNEVTAALGIVQLERLPDILDWKRRLAAKYDRVFEDRLVLPHGFESGYYKYIVFNTDLKEETGRVFDRPCHRIMPCRQALPNSDWAAENHACPPMYYGWDGADLDVDGLRERLLGHGLAAGGH